MCAALFIAVVLLLSCVSQGGSGGAAGGGVDAGGGQTLDAAIAGIASYFTARLPEGAKTAIVSFDAETSGLSDYVFEEFWNRFEESGKFVMVDRRNLERIRAEMNYQMSGEVSDDSARSIGRQYGADIIVYGRLRSAGGGYRLTAYATDVEKAASSQGAVMVRADSRLASLLNAPLEEKIDRAVAAMARGVNGRTTIAIGRIAYGDTQTVSSLSAYLKNSITTAALRQQDRFSVASDSESADFAVATRGLTVETPVVHTAIQAVVLGSFSHRDNDAEVTLQLVSTARGRVVLASSQFIVPAAELSRRRLSLLPEISRAQFDERQSAVTPYAGKGNSFTFTVSPDDLDGIYYDGEYMSMRIFSERDCYFRIVHVDANGAAQVIYPRAAADRNVIRAGETRSIPDNTRYHLGAPYGEEYILVAAYDRPFRVEAGSAAQISGAVITRGLTVEAESGASGPMTPIATARISYTILPRN